MKDKSPPKSKDEMLVYELELLCTGRLGEANALCIVSRELRHKYPLFSEKLTGIAKDIFKLNLTPILDTDIKYGFQRKKHVNRIKS